MGDSINEADPMLEETLENASAFEDMLNGMGINVFMYYPQERRMDIIGKACKGNGRRAVYTSMPDSYAEEAVHPNYREAYCALFNRINAGSHTARATFGNLDKTVYSRVTLTVVKWNEAGQPLAAVGVTENLTEEVARGHQEKEQFESAKRQYMDVVRALSIDYFAIYLVDVEHNVIRALRAKDILLPQVTESIDRKASFDSVINGYIETFVYPEDKEKVAQELSAENIRRRLQGERVFFLRYRRMGREGYEHTELKLVDVSEGQDGSRGVLAARSVDADVRREMEQQELLKNALARVQHANDAKRIFLSNMSHDIRTPMNAIMGFSNIAADHLDDKERVRYCITKVLAASNHLQSLINDILDMSRIESGEMLLHENKCGLADVMHSLMSVIQPQIRSRQLRFFVETVDIHNEEVYIDAMKINQVLINILGNAIKFTQPGGDIYFTIIQSPCAKEGWAKYSFIVRDTGIGMSKEFQKHVFELFERETTSTLSQTEGTGLGLSITKSIVDAMGGSILVESVQGQGSTFTVELMLRLHGVSEICHEAKELEGRRVLVMGDDPASYDNVMRLLGELHVRHESAASDEEAVLRIQRASEQGDAFDGYLIDWVMPGMGGIELTKKLRGALGRDVPIVVLTAYDWSDIKNEAREAGVTLFCSKPLFLSSLADTLLRSIHVLPPEEEKKDWDKEKFAKSRLLLVEDNELNREIAEEILSEEGFPVESAADGAEAIAMLERSEEGYYKLILMDIQMPVINGYDATKIIRSMPREDLANLPIIAMTANAFEEDKQAALKSGMNDHLAKPIDIDQMLYKINNWI